MLITNNNYHYYYCCSKSSFHQQRRPQQFHTDWLKSTINTLDHKEIYAEIL